MTCFFDGDSISSKILSWTEEYLSDKPVELVIVAEEGRRFSEKLKEYTLYVPRAKDSADQKILQNCSAGDLVCTRDFYLAQKVIEIGAYAMNNEGLIFTPEYLKMRITESRLNLAIKAGGHGTKSFNKMRNNHKLEGFKTSLKKWLKENQ